MNRSYSNSSHSSRSASNSPTENSHSNSNRSSNTSMLKTKTRNDQQNSGSASIKNPSDMFRSNSTIHILPKSQTKTMSDPRKTQSAMPKSKQDEVVAWQKPLKKPGEATTKEVYFEDKRMQNIYMSVSLFFLRERDLQ